MNIIESFILQAYKKVRDKIFGGASRRRISDEDMACHIAGVLGEKEERKVLDNIILRSGKTKLLQREFVLSGGMPADELKEPPGILVAKVKYLVSAPLALGILDAVLEFAGDVIRVVKTTGIVRGSVPALAFRDTKGAAKRQVVELSKAVSGITAEIKVEKVKNNLVKLTVQLRYRKTRLPLPEERISLIHDDRELRSSLTESGKVEFDNVPLQDYKIVLMHKEQPLCIARIQLLSSE